MPSGLGCDPAQEHHELLFTLALGISTKGCSPLLALDPVSCALGRPCCREEIPTEAMLWLQKPETFLFRLPPFLLNLVPALHVILDVFPVTTQSSETNES